MCVFMRVCACVSVFVSMSVYLHACVHVSVLSQTIIDFLKSISELFDQNMNRITLLS